MITQNPFLANPQGSSQTVSSTDSAEKNTYTWGPGAYFTGFIVNRDVTNLIDIFVIDPVAGAEVPYVLLPQTVINFKNVLMEGVKIVVDKANASASAVQYLIQGKTQTPQTDYETATLEADSEIFFRLLGGASAGSVAGFPFIVVTPTGSASSGLGPYGPSTPGTSTNGIQEAINNRTV